MFFLGSFGSEYILPYFSSVTFSFNISLIIFFLLLFPPSLFFGGGWGTPLTKVLTTPWLLLLYREFLNFIFITSIFFLHFYPSTDFLISHCFSFLFVNSCFVAWIYASEDIDQKMYRISSVHLPCFLLCLWSSVLVFFFFLSLCVDFLQMDVAPWISFCSYLWQPWLIRLMLGTLCYYIVKIISTAGSILMGGLAACRTGPGQKVVAVKYHYRLWGLGRARASWKC